MKTIRANTFETNSSSTHSLCITTEDKYLQLVPNSDGSIILNGGEFGWGWDKFNDPLTKANYCALDNLHNPHRLELLKKVLKKETGANEILINISDDWNSPTCSYIDHEGHGTSADAFLDEETLKNFIFGENSWLYIGNDNSNPPNKFYDDPNQKYPYTVEIWDKDFKVTSWDLKDTFPEDEELISDLFYNIFDKIRYNASNNKWEFESHSWCSVEKYFEFRLPWKDFNYNDYFDLEKGYVSLVYKNRLTDDLEFLKLSFKIIKNEIDK